MDTEQDLGHEVPSNKFEKAGLTKENVGGLDVYTIDVSSEDAKEKLDRLREVVQSQRVAVEVGPGNQLDSLLFAAGHAKADVVVGIDPYFDYSAIQAPSGVDENNTPTVILMKGDAWGNRNIHDFFGTYEDDRSKRLAIYSQMVSPDTLMTEALMGPATALSKDGYMIVLDSGAVESLGSQHFPEQAIERKLMAESGNSNPTHLDWVKHMYRSVTQTEFDKGDYEKGVSEKKYPPSSYLRGGKMLVIQKPLAAE